MPPSLTNLPELLLLTLSARLVLSSALAPLVWSVQDGLEFDAVCAGSETLSQEDFLEDFACQVKEGTPRVFNCSGRDMPYFPEDGLVPRASEVLDFSHNKLDCLPKINETVSECTSNCSVGCIRDLRLRDNEIAHVHSGAFTSLVCLTSLSLANNLITNDTILRSRPFERLVNLMSLDLSGNPLGSLRNQMLVEVFFPHLRVLDLSNCQLEFIDRNALDDFNELQVLNLGHNRLTHLHGQTFQGYHAIKVLDLSNNQLTAIDGDTFGDMKVLEDLFLHHNQLHVISADAFHHDADLSFLTLNVNQFPAVPYAAIQKLKSLKMLDVSRNPITKLLATSSVTSVEELKLDHLEELTLIEDAAFTGFQRVHTLSIRFARGLISFPDGAFRGNFSSLRRLLLDHNGLTTLPRDLLPWRQLTTLALHDNNWLCDCYMAWAAGSGLINATIVCQDPYRLQGQILNTLQPDELSCPRSLTNVKVIISLTLLAVAMAIMTLMVWQRRRRMPCWCLRGVHGQYVTVFTRETDVTRRDNNEDGSRGGEAEDLDLGSGAGGGGEGRVQILLKTLRSGYRRVATKDTGSVQDLTTAMNV